MRAGVLCLTFAALFVWSRADVRTHGRAATSSDLPLRATAIPAQHGPGKVRLPAVFEPIALQATPLVRAVIIVNGAPAGRVMRTLRKVR